MKYRLDTQGRIISVTGFGDLRDRLKAAMPSEVFQTLAATMTEEAMNAREIAEWNGRVGDFVGKSFAIGDAVLSTSEFPLPDGGKITYYSATKVEGKAKCRTGNCVRVQFRYGSNPSSFVGFASGVMAKMSKLVDASGKERLKVVGSASIVGDGHRVIDHRTMLIYEERNSRTMKMVMDVPGKGKVPVTMIESRDYQFDYE